MKKIPNPYGKKGNPDHQDAIDKLVKLLKLLKKIVVKEKRIKITKNKSRYADVAVLDEENKVIEIHQVGRTNKKGKKVKREQLAIDDIEKTTNIKVIFHALIVLIIAAIICITIYKNIKTTKIQNKSITKTEKIEIK